MKFIGGTVPSITSYEEDNFLSKGVYGCVFKGTFYPDFNDENCAEIPVAVKRCSKAETKHYGDE